MISKYYVIKAIWLKARSPIRKIGTAVSKVPLKLARLVYLLFPNAVLSPNERLWPPELTGMVARDWFSTYGKKFGARFSKIEEDCVVLNRRPNTVHSGVRHQLTMDSKFLCQGNFVTEIPNGRVWGEGFVISPDNKLLEDVSVDFEKPKDGISTVRRNWKLEKLHEVDGSLAVLSTDGGRLYYHWLFQLLPRFELIRLAGFDLSKIDYFLVNRYTTRYERESLNLLGIGSEKIITSDRFPHVRAKKLIVPSIALGAGCFRPWMCEFLRRTFLPARDALMDSKGARIYISRRAARYRRVLNEDEVIRLLLAKNFQIVELETLSVMQQASLVASCRVIVSPHGGGLSNLVFCSPGTKVIEIFSPELVAGYYWKLSNQLGLDYYYLLGSGSRESQDENYEQSWNAFEDIVVDMKILEKTLRMADV